MEDDELSALLKRDASRHRASDRLRAAVVTHIALQSAARNERRGLGASIFGMLQLAGFGRPGLWPGFAGGVLLTLAVVFAPALWRSDSVAQSELVALHVQALGNGPLFQVASSDRHTVKPWFQGKLDYAPQVMDLAEDGFPLVGGRVDSVKQQPTAAMVYNARKHFITVFERPADHKQALAVAQQRGFNIIHWSDGVMDIWAISDVEKSELQRFAMAWIRKAG